jgi:hypothetical protein
MYPQSDGFTVKRLMALVPKARGEAYNNYGFRISVSDVFDSTFDFRVFNFEVIEQVTGGGYQVVEGPFYVSFASDAMSRSQESMFISAVLSKYSMYFDAFVNEKALDDLAVVLDQANAELYPNIFDAFNPNLFDVVSGTYPAKDNSVKYTAACRSSVTVTSINASGVADPLKVADAGDSVKILLQCSGQDEAEEFQYVCAGGETSTQIVNAFKAILGPVVNFNGFSTGAAPNVLVIQNADAVESFEVINVTYTPGVFTTPAFNITYTEAKPVICFIGPASEEVNPQADIITGITPAPTIHNYTDVTSVNFLANGYNGTLYTPSQANAGLGHYTRDMLISRGFGAGGYIDPRVANRKEIVIDVVLDANYSDAIKNQIVSFCSEIRGDCFAIIDTGFTANSAQALVWRKSNPFSTMFAAIFTQDFVIDEPFSGMEARVTSSYFLASKVPEVDEAFGIHYPFVGPRRGVISGFKKLSWNPTETEKEALYKRQINYVESDVKRTKFGSQLTSQTLVSALSNINAVRTLLRIKRDVEELSEDYQFEFADPQTYSDFQYNLNGYLQRWIANRACTSINGKVYASAYDKQQKICRVRIDITFNYVIERILIDLVVNR